VHDLRDAMHCEDLLYQFGCQNTGLVSIDVNTDEVAGVDVDHHVRIEISAPTASQKEYRLLRTVAGINGILSGGRPLAHTEGASLVLDN
jgi:hypothetical protein